AEQERSQPSEDGRHPPPDHELLPQHALGLDPARVPRRLAVGPFPGLRDDALQAGGAGGCEEVGARADDMLDEAERRRRAWAEEGSETLLPGLDGQAKAGYADGGGGSWHEGRETSAG